MTVIVEKMKEHLLNFLKVNKLDIVREKNNQNFYFDVHYIKGQVNIEEFNTTVGNEKWNFPWLCLKNPTATHHNQQLIKTFLENKENYQLFLTHFHELGFNFIRQREILNSYIVDKAVLIHFLQNFTYKDKFMSYEGNSINSVLDKYCIGNQEQNIKIIQNVLKNTSGSYGASKTKVLLRKYLVEKFGENVSNSLKTYWEAKLKSDTLLYDIEDNKTIIDFINMPLLINKFNLETARSKKDYEQLLRDISVIVGNHFNIKQIKANEFDRQLYSIVAIVPQDFQEDLTSLWEPMIEQYMVIKNNKGNLKTELPVFLKQYILSSKLNKNLPDKNSVKVNKI